MDVANGWFRQFTRLYTFQQELTNDGQKYYFSVNLRKYCLFLASSAILAFGFMLGLIMVFLTFVSNYMALKSYIVYVIINFGLILLACTFLLFLTRTIHLIVIIPQLIKLQKFTLALKKEEVSVCEKSLTIPEKLTIRIFVYLRYYSSILVPTLMFEPLNLSPFSQISKVEKSLSYHEKRKLAEQLSSNLKIPLTDMFSSFEPGIYENKQNFAEKLKFTEFEPSGNFKLTTSKNVHSIQLPYEKAKTSAKLMFMLILCIHSLIISLIPFSSIAMRLATSLDFLLIGVFFAILIIAFFLLLILTATRRCKIVVSDDSISMIKQSIWGERRIFHSSFNELKDISIFRGRIKSKSSQIVFKSDKLTEFTDKIPKEAVTDAIMTINNLLVSRL